MNELDPQPLEQPSLRNHHRPLLWVLLSFMLGILANEHAHVSFGWLIFGAISFLSLSILVRQRIFSSVFLLCFIVMLGAAYSQNYQALPNDHINRLPYYYRQDLVSLKGVVVSDVESRPFFKGRKTVFNLDVSRIKTEWGWKSKRGIILVNLFRDEDIKYGDYIRIEGKLHRPFNFTNDSNFSYRDYLYRKGVTYILSVKKNGRADVSEEGRGIFLVELSLRLKHRLRDVLYTYLPKDEAGIMLAFLLGDRYDIPKTIYELFKVSGVAHIIAISGFNIGIVAYLIFFILKALFLPRPFQYGLTMVLLVFYAFLTGGQPPVVRATIMAVVFLMSYLIEREQESVNTLCVAALILLLMNPLNLFDVGFQLSFISVLFIILLYPKFMGVFYRWLPATKEEIGPANYVIRFFLQSMAVSLAAYLGVVPLIMYYFQIITPVVIIANMLVVPLASLIIFLGMGLLAAGIIFPAVAYAFANCVVLLLNLMIGCVAFFAQVPGAYFKLNGFPLLLVVAYYVILAAVLIIMGLPVKSGLMIDKEVEV